MARKKPRRKVKAKARPKKAARRKAMRAKARKMNGARKLAAAESILMQAPPKP